jgi:gamma-carbonic anhydrase
MSGVIVPLKGFEPKVARSAFIAPNATLIGDVEIADHASIWFGVILRGDGPGICIGRTPTCMTGRWCTLQRAVS